MKTASDYYRWGVEARNSVSEPWFQYDFHTRADARKCANRWKLWCEDVRVLDYEKNRSKEV